MARRPLDHIKVLDLTRLLPGGFCTLLLADLGADVLKVEEPGRGDYVRWFPPMKGGASGGHLALNRGKRSMTLNLKTAAGVGILRRAAQEADVVVESFRPGVMDRLGVGYEALREGNPALVYCAITGYGQDGPYRERAGHDINYIGVAGVLGITGDAAGPTIPGVQVGDIGGGALMAVIGILAALADRARTGEGRFVDISMLDGVVAWLGPHAMEYFIRGTPPARSGMLLNGGYACYRTYECADGKHLTLGALEPQFWEAFCNAIGAPELIAGHMGPPEVQRAGAERIAALLRTRSRDEWVRDLAELDACVGPVNDFDEAFSDPQVEARGLIRPQPTADGPVSGIANPIRFAGEPLAELAPAPALGEHTESVLTGLGYSADELVRFRAERAI